MVMTLVFFIVGLGVVLSFDWASGTFRSDAVWTVLFGVLIAAIVYIAFRYAPTRGSPELLAPGVCPACGRSIPEDALLCPYCGERLPRS